MAWTDAEDDLDAQPSPESDEPVTDQDGVLGSRITKFLRRRQIKILKQQH